MSSDNAVNPTPAPEQGSGQPAAQDGTSSGQEPSASADMASAQEPSTPKRFKYDDIGNGERFVMQYDKWLRYVPKLKKWFVWWEDMVWSEEHHDAVERLAKLSARSILNDANGGDADFARKVAGWAKYSASVKGLTSMVRTGSSEEAVVRDPEQFDADPWLLNAQNRTIDLRTGELLKHDASNLITKVLPVEYDPKATFGMWDTFLKAKVPDRELLDYLQRAMGYTLTGDVSEERMFFVYGGTSSGKSTLLEAIQSVLGPYATTSTFKMLLENRNEGAFQPDLWRHVGSRMVIAQEVKDNVTFEKSVIKTMVSCNPMVAKRLYCDPFEFKPQWKLWVAANTQPHIDAGDAAMWRRIKVLPFTQSIAEDEQNPKIRTTLATDPRALRAILAWMVKGSLMWQNRGLSEPQIVREASQAYRESNDEFRDFDQFLDTHYELDPKGFVSGAEIRQAYNALGGGDFRGAALDVSLLKQKLLAKGLTEGQSGPERVRGWRGISSRTH